MEEWEKGRQGVSSGSKSAKEGAKVVDAVGFVGAEGVDAVAVAYYKACQYARWMSGMWRYVQVEVQAFFKKGCVYFIVLFYKSQSSKQQGLSK